MTAQSPALAALVPQLRVAFANSVIPLFWVGLGVSVMSVVASLFITGSMKQQLAASVATPSAQQGEKKDLQQPASGMVP
jgi:hypothetical protein